MLAQSDDAENAETIPLMLSDEAEAPPGADIAEAPIDRLFRELAKEDQPGWQQIEDAIIAEWSRSGSAAMDLLLTRGLSALGDDDIDLALEHFTALTDHAPDFAEGWNARATAFFRADMYGPALSDIERTLALEPRHFGAMSGLAIILEQIGYPEDAYATWQLVQAIHPHRPAVKEALERLGKEVAGRSL